MIEPPKMPPIVSDVANAVGEFAQNTAERGGRIAERAGDKVGQAGEKVNNAAQQGLQNAGELAQNAAANVAKGVKTVDEAAGKVKDAIGQQVARFIEDGGLDLLNPAKILGLLDFGRSPIIPGAGDNGGNTGVRDTGGNNPVAPGNNEYAGFYNEINSLGGDIKSMQDQLTSGKNPDGSDMTADQKIALQFELQQAMQERLQLITLLSNLIKMEHDSAMAVINNTRG